MNFIQQTVIALSPLLPTLESISYAAAAFVAGILVKGWFDASFKRTVARFESKLRSGEAEDQAAREQVATIHKHLIERSAQRSSEIEKKKIEAIEQCWDAVLQLAPFRMIGNMSASVHLRKLLDGASKQTVDGQKLRDFSKTLLDGAPKAHSLMQEGSFIGLNKVRIYLPERIYETVTIYNAIIIRPYTILKLASMGLEPDFIKSSKETNNRLKSIIPAYADYIDTYDEDGYSFLYEVLENQILESLKKELGSQSSQDINTIKQVDDLVTSYKQARTQIEVPTSPGLANTTPPPSQ